MRQLWLDFLKTLGFAYWVTVADGTNKTYCFGPFGSAGAAIAAQDDCCRTLLQNQTGPVYIKSVRISTER